MISFNKTSSPYWWLGSISKYLFKLEITLISSILLAFLAPLQDSRVAAQAILSCDLNSGSQSYVNSAIADFNQGSQSSVSNQVITATNNSSRLDIENLGVVDQSGNPVNALNIVASGLSAEYLANNFSVAEAQQATIATLRAWASLPAEANSAQVIATIKQSLSELLDASRNELIDQLSEPRILATLAGFNSSSLATLGLPPNDITLLSQAEILLQAEGSFVAQIQELFEMLSEELGQPANQALLNNYGDNLLLEIANARQQSSTGIEPGQVLNFRFGVNNSGNETTSITIPNIETFTQVALNGTGQVIGVTYGFAGERAQTITDTAQTVAIPPGQTLNLAIQVEVGAVAADQISTLGLDLQTNCGDRNTPQTVSLLPAINSSDAPELIDPRGRVSGCAGETLADYLGFSVALYEVDPNDATASEPSSLTLLTTTELPDDPNNNIPAGIEPNIENSNPFFLTNEDQGQYSFLFDEATGQLDQGRTYILIVEPSNDSIFDQRRIKLTIGNRQERIVEYTATSLDGRPISAESDQTTITGQIVLVEDAERIGLNLAVLDLDTDVCDAAEISITKTADRATAEPGDIILYRLSIQNLASTNLTNLEITDTLPPGFRLQAESVQAEANSTPVAITTTAAGKKVVNFTANTTLEPGQVLTLVYAVEISANALRGEADNLAIVNAQRTDNNFTVRDGPAIYGLQLEAGIVRDSGTLIGRVFVDHNFDGEQQVGEPGVPHAVIYLENGNRIITDADGLFSVSNVLPGYHTGILDLTSIPEYNLAPNLRFIERNSTSRLVNLEPGGLVRMNFAVTPTPTTPKSRNQTRGKPTAPKTTSPISK